VSGWICEKVVMTVDHRLVFRDFAYWAAATGKQKWAATASRIAKYYY
jgi:hypothetical protein